MTFWSRQTYSSLDFLGDLGGLYDALRLIAQTIVAPFSSFALKAFVTKSLNNKNSFGTNQFTLKGAITDKINHEKPNKS